MFTIMKNMTSSPQEPLESLSSKELGKIAEEAVARNHRATHTRLDRLRDAVYDLGRRVDDIESILEEQFSLKSTVSSVFPYIPKAVKVAGKR